MIKNAQYPLEFTFKIGTFANDFVIKDNLGYQLALVRQKLFKLKEDIQVFKDDSKSQLLYNILADRWIDFNAIYSIKNAHNQLIGKIGREGMRSIWRASYNILDSEKKTIMQITEENPWIKVLDNLLGEVPILSIFTGYFFNPSYIVKKNDSIVFRLQKKPSFFGKRFELNKLADVQAQEEELVVTSLMMMVLLEREKG